jgi:tetratricopeptide (TPR) repeat protein
LQKKGQLDEAIAEFRRAAELAPRAPEPRHHLGMCLQLRGQLDEAITEFRRAVVLDPKAAQPHHHLGLVLRARGRVEEAIVEFRKATELAPEGALLHQALTDALLQQGRFAEARTAARRALERLPSKEPRRAALAQDLRRSDRLLFLDARVSAILEGKVSPAVAELLQLAGLCRDHGRPAAAAGLYAAAFAARPALADDLDSSNRYHAACAAARAATAGPEGPPFDGPSRAALRRQALGWLRADLALRTRRRQAGKLEGEVSTLWQRDDALAGVRDEARLAKLPPEERRQWRRLWAGVDALAAADPLEQGRRLALRRQWAESAGCYARALKVAPTEDGHFWFEYAAVLLLSGDRAGYLRVCAHMTARCGKAAALRAFHVARACTLAPGAVADPALPVRLAAAELAGEPREFWSLTEQGALHYRASRFTEAVPCFEQSLRADPLAGRAVLNWLWLALSCQRLGKAEAARGWLDRARAWLDRYGDEATPRAEAEMGLDLHNWLEAHVLRREAEALLGAANRRENP